MSMNLPFPRPAEPPIKPQYIVLFKGDDSDFQGNQSVDVVIDTELDTTGMKAHFRFMDFVQDFNSIPENKTLSLVFPNAKTSEFPLGAADATLRFEDASGKFRTVSNRIHIVVTNSVHEAYDNEDSQSITVTVKGTVTWDMIEGKPDIPSEFPEPSDDKPLMDGEASAGASTEYSRGDHRHPSDTSKLDGAAAYPAWDHDKLYQAGEVVSYKGRIWKCIVPAQNISPGDEMGRFIWGDSPVTIDDLKQDALSPAQLAAVNSGATAAKVAAWDGYAAQIAQKASFDDLPYAMVTPEQDGFTEWKFSDGNSYQPTLNDFGSFWTYLININGEDFYSQNFTSEADALAAAALYFEDVNITATRHPKYTLLARVNNLIDATTGIVTLTLPAYQKGKVRDLLVACIIGLDGNDEPWSVIFQGADGEEISFKAEGDDASTATFPVPTAAGEWWYSLTERAPHVFAVSLKQLQSVSQPTQTQGGS